MRSHTACMAARTSSRGQPGAKLPDELRRDGHGGVGGLLGAPDPGDLRGRLGPPAGDEQLRVDEQLDAVGAQVVGHRDGEVGRHDARGRCRAARHARSAISTVSAVRVTPAAISSSAPSAEGSSTSIPCARTLSASSTLTVATRRPSVSAYRNGSTIPSGMAWKRSGDASGAP